MTRQQAQHSAGFTLIEILIVVVILGLLAAIIIPQFSESAEAAKQSAAATSLKTVRSQVELYIFRHDGQIPSIEDLENNGYLTAFEQPEGYCIEIDSSTGAVTMDEGDCAP